MLLCVPALTGWFQVDADQLVDRQGAARHTFMFAIFDAPEDGEHEGAAEWEWRMLDNDLEVPVARLVTRTSEFAPPLFSTCCIDYSCSDSDLTRVYGAVMPIFERMAKAGVCPAYVGGTDSMQRAEVGPCPCPCACR